MFGDGVKPQSPNDIIIGITKPQEESNEQAQKQPQGNQKKSQKSKKKRNLRKRRTFQLNDDELGKALDFDQARSHGRARKVYKATFQHENTENQRDMDERQKSLQNKAERCPCCGLPLNGERIDLTGHLTEIYHLGSGYALYFVFIKYCIALLSLLFAVQGMYSIVTNSSTDDCLPDGDTTTEDPYCVQGFDATYTIANKRNDEDKIQIQLILDLVVVILMVLFFHFIRYKLRKIHLDSDQRTLTPGDYTIKLTSCPTEIAKSDEVVKVDEKFIENWLNEFSTDQQKVKIVNVMRTKDIAKLVDLVQQKEKLYNEYQKAKKSGSPKKKELKNKVKETISAIKAERLLLKDTEFVLVTCEYPDQADYLDRIFHKSFLKRFWDFITPFLQSPYRIGGKRVALSMAPEPSDMIWHNLGTGTKQKSKLRLKTNLIALLLIGVGFGLIVLLNFGQAEISFSAGEDSSAVQWFSFLSSVLIFLINSFLRMSIQALSKHEKRSNFTGYFQTVTIKLTIAQLINTAFSQLFAKLVLSGYYEDKTGSDGINFYGAGGLLANMYFVFLLSAFTPPLSTLFNPFFLWKRYNRQKIEKDPEHGNLTQEKANRLFEDPQMDIAYKSSLIIKSMLLCAFYAPAMPFAMIYTMIGLILIYWADKFALFRLFALPNALGNSLAKVQMELLEWVPFVYAIGNLVFAKTLENSDNETAYPGLGLIYAQIAVSLLFIIVPMNNINKKLFALNSTGDENISYEEAKFERFITDYDIEYPLTRKEAIQKRVEALKKKAELTGKGLGYFDKMTEGKLNNVFFGSGGIRHQKTQEHDSDDDEEDGGFDLFGGMKAKGDDGNNNANPMAGIFGNLGGGGTKNDESEKKNEEEKQLETKKSEKNKLERIDTDDDDDDLFDDDEDFFFDFYAKNAQNVVSILNPQKIRLQNNNQQQVLGKLFAGMNEKQQDALQKGLFNVIADAADIEKVQNQDNAPQKEEEKASKGGLAGLFGSDLGASTNNTNGQSNHTDNQQNHESIPQDPKSNEPQGGDQKGLENAPDQKSGNQMSAPKQPFFLGGALSRIEETNESKEFDDSKMLSNVGHSFRIKRTMTGKESEHNFDINSPANRPIGSSVGGGGTILPEKTHSFNEDSIINYKDDLDENEPASLQAFMETRLVHQFVGASRGVVFKIDSMNTQQNHE